MKRISALLALAVFAAGCASSGGPAPATTTAEQSRAHAAFDQARGLAARHAALEDQARADNAAQINRLLASLDDATLRQDTAALPAGDPLYNFAGRALLARGLPLPRAFARVGDYGAGNRPPADADGYRPPLKLALLLPLSGSLAAAAAPVRDGFLAGYYGESRRRPDITFYDSAGDAAAAYDRAVSDGNDFVVGPLARDQVDALFARGTLSVPVLALNRGTRAPRAGSASFSLSPEDEGAAAAHYLFERKARRVLVVGGGDESQRRAVSAFREAFVARGGSIVDSLADAADPGMVAARAADTDALFLALKGSAARTLVPKLALAGFAGKPVVATSAIAAGTGKPVDDAVLDGIAYPSETWDMRDVPGLPSQSSAAGRLATARGPAARLFAFGFDAWRITAYLERLATDGNAKLDGATGTLRLDGFGNVVRTPAWSTFRGGVPTPLADAR